MKFRTYRNTDLTVSTVGFGLWTISTGWWGQFTEGEAIALMHRAFDLGITLFDAADTYGNGLSEELIAKAFPTRRDEIVIATKIGYDVAQHGSDERRGQRAIPHDFSPAALVRSTDAALKRLKTDRIDLLQLHNIGLEQVDDDAVWETLERLVRAGKVATTALRSDRRSAGCTRASAASKNARSPACSTSITCSSRILAPRCTRRRARPAATPCF